MRQSALEQYADIANAGGRQFLPDEDAHIYCLLWQDNRDEAALERLFVDKALLVLKRTSDLKKHYSGIATEHEIDSWALEGIQKGVEGYPVGETDASLNTYVVNGALWNIGNELRHYRHGNLGYQDKAAKLLREAENTKGDALTFAEQEAILDTIGPSLKTTFYARQLRNTGAPITAQNEARAQHPSTDDQPAMQWTPSADQMDTLFSPAALDPYYIVERQKRAEDIDDVLETLTDRERHVIILRYGIGFTDMPEFEEGKRSDFFKTLEEVGDVLGVSRERVRQIEQRALRKLRHPSRSEHLQIYSQWGEETQSTRLEDFEIAEMEDAAFDEFLALSADPE